MVNYFCQPRNQGCLKIIGNIKINYQIEKRLIEIYSFEQLIIELVAINWQSIIIVLF